MKCKLEMIQRRVRLSTPHVPVQTLEPRIAGLLPALRLLVYQNMKKCQNKVKKIVVYFKRFH